MGIVPVQKGQKLTAQAWNQLATTVNNIAGGSTAAAAAGKVVKATIKNNTSAAIQAGNILTVYLAGTVRLAQYTPDEARAAWMNNGFQLDGYASGANGVPALLIDGIDEGGIGRALVYGLCAGYIAVSGSTAPDLVTFRASSGVFAVPSSGETGDWRVIASSAVSNGQVFAYLVPLGGGGGGNYTSDKAVTDVTPATASFYTGHSWDNSKSPITGVTVESAYSLLHTAAAQSHADAVVTDVSVNSSGDIMVTKALPSITSSATASGTAALSFQTTNAVTGVTLTKDDFLQPPSSSSSGGAS